MWKANLVNLQPNNDQLSLTMQFSDNESGAKCEKQFTVELTAFPTVDAFKEFALQEAEKCRTYDDCIRMLAPLIGIDLIA